MATANAQELKPSDQRSLEKTMESLSEMTVLLEAEPDPATEDWADKRQRELKKVANTLKRAQRSLSRMPADHNSVARALVAVDDLTQLAADASQALAQFEHAANAQQTAALSRTHALLESPDTADNVARMKQLADQFMQAWHTFEAIEHRFTHGLFKIWDETGINELIYTLTEQQVLLAEAELLLESYQTLARSREGASLLLSPVTDLERNRDQFASRIPSFIAEFPEVQRVAAQAFVAEVAKQHTVFSNANKERDTSALLNLNPNFPQLDSLRNRMQAQSLIAQALGVPALDDIQNLQTAALAQATAVGSEIAGWQADQSGREADALAAQQAEYQAQRERNAAQAEADRVAWQARRAVLEQQRKAQVQRNQTLRKVTK